MGSVNQRLQRQFQAVREGVTLPVIVTTLGPVDQATVDAVRAVGAGPIRFVSEVGNSFGTTATADVAQRMAQVANVREVWPDEPIVAL